MTARCILPVILVAASFPIFLPGHLAPPGKERPEDARKDDESPDGEEGGTNVTIHYLEIVTNDVDALCAAYERLHGLDFGPKDPDLGQARVATRQDGDLVGIREPIGGDESPTVRTYIEVDDIRKAVEEAEEGGAMIAYPPTKQGERGTFAIFFQGDVQHGLWQR